MLYLVIKSGRLVAEAVQGGVAHSTTEVRTLADVERVVAAHRAGHPGDAVMCSSTLDFPQEASDDPAVWRLADAIRGNDTTGDDPA